MNGFKRVLAITAAAILCILIAFWLVRSSGTNSRAALATQPPNEGRLRSPSRDSEQAAENPHQQELDELDAIRKRAFEDHMRASEEGRMGSPPLIPLTAGGKLSRSAIEQLGLDPTQSQKIEAAIQNAIANAAKDLSSRAKLVSTTKSGDETTNKYYARARTDRGKDFISNLIKSELLELMPEEQATLFIQAANEQAVYGGFGRFDVEMTYTTKDGGQQSVKYKYISSATGATARSGGGNLADENLAPWNDLIQLLPQ